MGILNSLSTSAESAFSVRKLLTAYSGYCMKIRRTSDNSEVDVAFDTNDAISGSSSVNPTTWGSTLSAFSSGTTCYVVTWYDQSGNGNDITNADSTEQPRLVDSGTLEVDSNDNAKVVFHNGDQDLRSSAFTALSQPCTHSNVASITNDAYLFDGISSSNEQSVRRYVATLVMDSDTESTVDSSFDSDQHVLTFLFDGASSYFWKDGSATGAGTGVGSETLTGHSLGKKTNGTGPMSGYHQEYIVFGDELSTSDRETLEDDQDAYYINPPAGIEITHTAGTFNGASNTHTITAVAPVSITHTAGTLNGESNTHTISTTANIDIEHSAGIFNGESNTHTVTVTENVLVNHTSGTLNGESNTHTVTVTENLLINHAAGTFNGESNTHTVTVTGNVNIAHTTGTLNGESNTHTVTATANVTVEHSAGDFNGESVTHTVATTENISISHTAGTFNGASNTHTITIASAVITINHVAGEFDFEVSDVQITTKKINTYFCAVEDSLEYNVNLTSSNQYSVTLTVQQEV